jgi:hypothetical protein
MHFGAAKVERDTPHALLRYSRSSWMCYCHIPCCSLGTCGGIINTFQPFSINPTVNLQDSLDCLLPQCHHIVQWVLRSKMKVQDGVIQGCVGVCEWSGADVADDGTGDEKECASVCSLTLFFPLYTLSINPITRSPQSWLQSLATGRVLLMTTELSSISTY